MTPCPDPMGGLIAWVLHCAFTASWHKLHICILLYTHWSSFGYQEAGYFPLHSFQLSGVTTDIMAATETREDIDGGSASICQVVFLLYTPSTVLVAHCPHESLILCSTCVYFLSHLNK